MAGSAELTGPGARRATILDVAAHAGVSRQTVTRAMNDMPGISEATKRRVLDAARDLAYRPSRFGRGLVTGGTRQLGLVVHALQNPYFPELAAAITRVAGMRGWNVVLADVGNAADGERSVSSLFDQVDAVIGYLGELPADVAHVPTVRLDLDEERDGARAGVFVDRQPAIEHLAAHLATVGTRRPLILDSSEPGHPSLRARQLTSSLRSHGVTAELVQFAASSAEHTATVAAQILRRAVPPDAILAFNDVMALGVLSACRHESREVPGDLRVTGVDGLSIGTLVTPTLTTLAVDFDELASAALDLAEGLHDGTIASSGPDAQRTVRLRLVLRESA